MVLGVRWIGRGVVFVLVSRLHRIVEVELLVTLMSCCPRIFLIGLEREGWKGSDTLMAYSRVCLLKAARD